MSVFTASDPNSTTTTATAAAASSANSEITTTAVGDNPVTFSDLGVRSETVEALREAGIVHPFPIQAFTLPLALRGSDIIGQARTGTGKTLAFGIPVVQSVHTVAEGPGGTPQALVVVPTRELCVQVTADIERAGARRAVRVAALYGGRAYEPQLAALRSGVDVVVGTPGRLLDLARQGVLDLAGVELLVLDEADEMLDLGFLPDVERIIALVPADRQTMLFSATMPGPVVALARRFMRKPVHITAEEPDEGRTVPTTHQHIFRAHALNKMEVLARVLQSEGRGLAMVFVRTRRTADRVAEDLLQRHFAAAAVHGDLGQGQREQALRAFRAGKIDVLVATDVAARGIDVGGVTHVVNYQCPEDEKVYLHRIGRTGRAGGSGVAVTFVDWDDMPRWQLVSRALNLPSDEPLETYSTSPHLFELLGIPTDTRGTLPATARTRAGLAAEKIEDLGESRRGRGRTRTRDRRAGWKGESAGNDARTNDGQATGTASSGGDSRGPARKARSRRRTRGGGFAAAAAIGLVEVTPVAESVPDGAASPPSAATAVGVGGVGGVGGGATTPEAAGAATAGPAELAGDPTPRRRRRRRGGRSRNAATTTPDLPGMTGDDQSHIDDAPRAESA